MALLYSKAMGNLYVEVINAMHRDKALTVYGGVQPTASEIISGWNSLYRLNSLAENSPLFHVPSVPIDIYSGNWNTQGTGFGFLRNYPSDSIAPTPSIGLKTGTATWAIWWNSAITDINLQNVTIPSQLFTVLPVTNFSGKGIIKLVNTSIQEGNYYLIDSIQLATYLVGAV